MIDELQSADELEAQSFRIRRDGEEAARKALEPFIGQDPTDEVLRDMNAAANEALAGVLEKEGVKLQRRDLVEIVRGKNGALFILNRPSFVRLELATGKDPSP